MPSPARFASCVVLLTVCGSVGLAAEDSLRALVDLVSDRSPDSLSRAEALYAKLTKDGAASASATHALALLRTREQKCSEAAELLNTLPNQDKYAVGVLRLRLWLALDRGEQELASRLVVLLREQARNSMLPATDRVEVARLLGGVVGGPSAAEATALPKELLTATVHDLTEVADQKVSFEFRLAQQAASKRRQYLADLISEVTNDKSAATTRLAAVEAEKSAHDMAIETAQDKLAQTIEANRKEGQNLSADVRKLTASAVALRRELNQVTPGFPPYPTEPKPPPGSVVEKVAPRLPSKLDGGEKRSLSAAEERAYDRDKLAYQQALRDYPAKFAAWKSKDEARRKNLNDQMSALDKELTDARGEEKKRRQEADKLRAEIAVQKDRAHDLESKVRTLKSVLAANRDGDTSQLLRRPSNYDLISYPAERQRLLQANR